MGFESSLAIWRAIKLLFYINLEYIAVGRYFINIGCNDLSMFEIFFFESLLNGDDLAREINYYVIVFFAFVSSIKTDSNSYVGKIWNTLFCELTIV